MEYRSSLLKTLETLAFLPALLSGFSSQKQELHIDFFDKFELNPHNPGEVLTLEIMSKHLEVSHDGRLGQAGGRAVPSVHVQWCTDQPLVCGHCWTLRHRAGTDYPGQSWNMEGGPREIWDTEDTRTSRQTGTVTRLLAHSNASLPKLEAHYKTFVSNLKICSKLYLFQDFTISQNDIIVHEDFRKSYGNVQNDIALVRLPGKVTHTIMAQFACLPLPGNSSLAGLDNWGEATVGREPTVVGWGSSCYEELSPSTRTLCYEDKSIPNLTQQKLQVCKLRDINLFYLHD